MRDMKPSQLLKSTEIEEAYDKLHKRNEALSDMLHEIVNTTPSSIYTEWVTLLIRKNFSKQARALLAKEKQ